MRRPLVRDRVAGVGCAGPFRLSGLRLLLLLLSPLPGAWPGPVLVRCAARLPVSSLVGRCVVGTGGGRDGLVKFIRGSLYSKHTHAPLGTLMAVRCGAWHRLLRLGWG